MVWPIPSTSGTSNASGVNATRETSETADSETTHQLATTRRNSTTTKVAMMTGVAEWRLTATYGSRSRLACSDSNGSSPAVVISPSSHDRERIATSPVRVAAYAATWSPQRK